MQQKRRLVEMSDCHFCYGECSCHINPPCFFCEEHVECSICGQLVCLDNAVTMPDGEMICPSCAETTDTCKGGRVDSLRRLTKHYGFDAQVNKYCEEGTELLEALKAYSNGSGTVDSVLDEIADVQVMLESLKLCCTIGEAKIQERMDYKIKRAIERMEEEDE